MSDPATQTIPSSPPIADPAPLGLAGFALTTFILSAHNANWAPDVVWVGVALFYGGLAQFMAGMHEFRNRNTFGSTAFTSYGAFWFGLATFLLLDLAHVLPKTVNINMSLGWFLLSFAIFNTYMLLWSTRVNKAVFAVFLTLEVTEIVLFAGFFLVGAHHRLGTDVIHAGGYVGILTAACAWYASAAGVVNNMAGRTVVNVGAPLWSDQPRQAMVGQQRPRMTPSGQVAPQA
jgi:succinate-acetate transporter protein